MKEAPWHTVSALVGLLRFSVVHSLRDMWRNRVRTAFALVCVATGVTAVVALRSLAFMVGDELTTNLAELNRGDIRLYASRDVPEIATFSPQGDPIFTREGERVVREWADQEGLEITAARMAGVASVRRVTDGRQEVPQPLLTLFIEPEQYPFYDTIVLDEPPGASLKDVFGSSGGEVGAAASVVLPRLSAVGALLVPGDSAASAWTLYPAQIMAHPRPVVISSNLTRASSLGLRMGDVLRVGAPETLYVVAGIAPSSAETILTTPQTVLLDFLYLPLSDLPIMGDQALPDQIFVRVPLGRDVSAVEKGLIAYLNRVFKTGTDFGKQLNRVTVAELEEQNSETANVIDDMILVMGLSSLLIGGIGIVNTMLVVVSRRTLEIAVLKTLGLKAWRVTWLFLVEAVLMGLLGGVLGAGIGVVLSYLIRGVGEEAFSIVLHWRLYPEAIFSGLALGMVITVLFGFLPTLIAGQVRPAVVLRPNEAQMPAAGLLQTLLTLIVMIVVLGLLVDTVVEGAISISPVYMLLGAGALIGLFTGVIVANTRLGQLTAGGLRAFRQVILLYGAAAIGAALASGVVLVLSELWLSAGLGTVKPAGDVIYAWGRGDLGWVVFWAGLTGVIGSLIRWLARGLAGVIALGSLGASVGGLLGWLAGSFLQELLAGSGTWSFLAHISTGIVLVEGSLALLGAVYIGYWLLIWLVGKMPSMLLMGLVSFTLVAVMAAAAYSLSLFGTTAFLALFLAALFIWAVSRLLFRGRVLFDSWKAGDMAPTSALGSVRSAGRGSTILMPLIVLLAGWFALSARVETGLWWSGAILVLVVGVLLWRRLWRRYGVDGRLVLREIAGRRSRVSSTLLGLSVGVAGLSVLTLTTSAIGQLLEAQLNQNAEGNLLVVARRSDQREAVKQALSRSQGVESFSQFAAYRAVLMEINGEPVQIGENQRVSEEEDPRENSNFEVPEQGAVVLLSVRETLDTLPHYRMVSGRRLEPEDAGNHRIMIRETFITQELGIETGDRLMFRFENAAGDRDDVLVRLTVVGMVARQSEQTGFGDQFLVPPETLPETVIPTNILTVAMIDRSSDVYMDNALIALSDIPGVIPIELTAITQLLKNLLEQLKAIPTLVAWLALVAGTAIIANTVALATQERRRQIGVMKAVGLKGRRVLMMLMIENGLIGLIAGIIGVSVGMAITIILVLSGPQPDELKETIQLTTIVEMVLMSVAVAIGAAALSAWTAAAEKPMNVLRYE